MSSRENLDGEANVSNQSRGTGAPAYSIGPREVVAVEHPFSVRDIDKGIATFGNTENLIAAVNNPSDRSLKLYYRPGNRNASPLTSVNKPSTDLLMKVTVPKRTGRKRKRGDAGSFSIETSQNGHKVGDDGPSSQDSIGGDPTLLCRSLQDNPHRSKIDVVGRVQRTHRFRGLPDFVLSTSNAPFMKKINDTILPFDYNKLKEFRFDMSKGAQPNSEIIPPPMWTPHDLPFNYKYRQNPATQHVVDDEGNVTTVNVYAPLKGKTFLVPGDVATVPTGPSHKLPPLESLDANLQKLIAAARRLFGQRPVYTRRALRNSLPVGLWKTIGGNSAKFVFHYVSYMFTSGPWRDAFVAFGVDPRTDSKYRIYQTMMFKAEMQDHPRSRRRVTAGSKETWLGSDSTSHLFDGETVSKDSKSWQVCDISEPLIVEILSTDNLRRECDLDLGGFFQNGTWAKAKILTRCKIQDLRNGGDGHKDPARTRMYDRIAREVPDVVVDRLGRPRARDGGDGVDDLEMEAEERKVLSWIQSTAKGYQRSSIEIRRSAKTVKGVNGSKEVEESEEGEEDEAEEDDQADTSRGRGSGKAKRGAVDPALQAGGEDDGDEDGDVNDDEEEEDDGEEDDGEEGSDDDDDEEDGNSNEDDGGGGDGDGGDEDTGMADEDVEMQDEGQ